MLGGATVDSRYNVFLGIGSFHLEMGWARKGRLRGVHRKNGGKQGIILGSASFPGNGGRV